MQHDCIIMILPQKSPDSQSGLLKQKSILERSAHFKSGTEDGG